MLVVAWSSVEVVFMLVVAWSSVEVVFMLVVAWSSVEVVFMLKMLKYRRSYSSLFVDKTGKVDNGIIPNIWSTWLSLEIGLFLEDPGRLEKTQEIKIIIEQVRTIRVS